MELPLLFIMRDMRNNSQKLSSFKKQSKTIKLLPQTTLDTQRISDKAKLTEDKISFMELKTYQVEITGMLLDASTVNQLKKKFNQIMT
jgi:hypothetical protein